MPPPADLPLGSWPHATWHLCLAASTEARWAPQQLAAPCPDASGDTQMGLPHWQAQDPCCQRPAAHDAPARGGEQGHLHMASMGADMWPHGKSYLRRKKFSWAYDLKLLGFEPQIPSRQASPHAQRELVWRQAACPLLLALQSPLPCCAAPGASHSPQSCPALAHPPGLQVPAGRKGCVHQAGRAAGFLGC